MSVYACFIEEILAYIANGLAETNIYYSHKSENIWPFLQLDGE